MYFLRTAIIALAVSSLFIYSTEETPTKSTPPSSENKNWLQEYIEEQKKLQEIRQSDSKENPFKAIQKSSEPSSKKESEPFSLLSDKEKSSSSPITSPESTKSKAPLGEITFKPAISGMNAEIYNKQRQENQSRSFLEEMEKNDSAEKNIDLENEETLEKMRRQRIQENIKSNSETDKLLNDNIRLSSTIDNPNLQADTRNPYLQQNRSSLERERDRLNQETSSPLPTIQMIKPVETIQLIPSQNPQRSSFDNNPFQSPKAPVNPMLQLPGTQKRGVQDPNDFLRR